mgnify:FL=1
MQLTTTQTNAVNAYGKFLQGGITYGEAMRLAAAELGGTRCPTFLEALAAKHAAKYQCNYTWDGKGSAVFYNGKESTRETRNDAARKSWERNVMVWFKAPAAPKPQATSQRISKAHREAAQAYLAQFENVKDAIAVLRAIAN